MSTPIVAQIPVMSRSALEASKCGFRYHEVYVKGRSDESPFSLRGTAFHLAARRYTERLVKAHTPMDAEEARLAFQEAIAEAKTPPQLVAETRELFDRWSQHFTLDLEAYVECESKVIRKDGIGAWEFTPDLVYAHQDRNELEIIDWKSYFRALSDAQAKTLLQPRFYALAAMKEWPGFATYRFTLGFVRLNRFVSVVFTPDDQDDLEREVQAIEAGRLKRHETQDWTPQAGEVCAFCQLACPLFTTPETTGYVRVNSDESFQAWGQTLIAQEKRRKVLQSALKSYVAINGPQVVNGEVFQFTSSTKRSYEAAALFSRLTELGITAAFSITASALKALVKIHPSLDEKLRPCLHESLGSARFGHKSLKSSLTEREDDDDE